MKVYTIIGGVNGAGKSSLTGTLKRERTDLGTIIDVDKITLCCGGNPIAGGKLAIKKIDECIERGVSFTQETTLSGARTEKTVRRAKESGYHIRLYYVGLNSVDDSIERIKNRVRRGGHDIPVEDVTRRYEKRFEDLIKVLPYCDEAVFFDNDNGFIEVAEYKNGDLTIKNLNSPEWIKSFAAVFNRI